MRQSAWLPPKSVFACFGILAIALSLPSRVQAQQVVSDGMLNTNVTRSLNDFTITDGARSNSGTNLFHSFSEFSIPTGGSAFFDNAADVANIFSRVTGGSVSSIDGLIRSNGNANLFLLNPNGIVFGANARLNIGGSFVGTTARAIQFAGGAEFSTINLTSVPLLTMSVPIGLQMGQTSGPITVQGAGHNILRSNVFTPIRWTTSPTGLTVNPGKTLALVGNNISLAGGALSALSGHVELGSVSEGQVGLSSFPHGWQFDYRNATSLANISLSQAAFINASGVSGGSIAVRGQDIKLYDSSIVLVQNLGTQDAGQISIYAAGLLDLRGIAPNRDPSNITSETLSQGAGANISTFAHQIQLQDGATIFSSNFRSGGRGGDVFVQAADSIIAVGTASFDPTRLTALSATANIGGGQGGQLTVTARQLTLRDGATLANPVIGGAQGGNVHIIADQIDAIGQSVIGVASGISTSTVFGGNAGRLQLDVKRLSVNSGASISTGTLGNGNAGDLIINATESIVVSEQGRFAPSRITASGEAVNLLFQQAFGISPIPTGNAGSININTPYLELTEGASILAGHVGTGATGTLKINANTIRLDAGNISTSTKSGQGGDVDLTIAEGLFLRRGSVINATAGGAGNGGNVLINSPIMLGLENSDIIANAERGIGGNIEITTQGIIGLQFQNTLNPRLNLTNDITASSELNINGTVQINNIGVDPNTGLVELASEPVDASQKVAEGCQSVQKSSSFIISGRGGVPKDPSKERSGRSWNDFRALSTVPTRNIAQPTQQTISVEATSWHRNAQTNKVELAAAAAPRFHQTPTCQPKIIGNQ